MEPRWPGVPSVAPWCLGPRVLARTTATVTLTHTLFYTVDVAVVVRDGQGNLVGHGGDPVQISIDGGDPLDAVDNGDGTYRASFLTFTAEHSIGVTLDGTPISGSPYSTP